MCVFICVCWGRAAYFWFTCTLMLQLLVIPILSGKEPQYMSHLGQAFDFVFLISFVTCSLKFKFSECSQRRNFISLQFFQPIIILSQFPHPMPFILYSFHKDKTFYFTTKKKKRFSKGNSLNPPSFHLKVFSLFSHPFLLPFSLLEEGVFFPFSFPGPMVQNSGTQSKYWPQRRWQTPSNPQNV